MHLGRREAPSRTSRSTTRKKGTFDMARTKHARVNYNGTQVRDVEEEQLYAMPKADVDIADYPVVDMYEVYVSQGDYTEPAANLLLAHPLRPVCLMGVVMRSSNRKYLLKFPVVSGFSLEDGPQGLSGNCNIYALGNCCWYRICSPSTGFRTMLGTMHLEARLYWILRDLRGNWMNTVDAAVSARFPALKENTPKHDQAVQQVVLELEPKDDQNYRNYWVAVDQMINERGFWTNGWKLGKEHQRYLLHHMIVDAKELYWTSSKIFKDLGEAHKGTRKEVFELHKLAIPGPRHSSSRASDVNNSSRILTTEPNVDKPVIDSVSKRSKDKGPDVVHARRIVAENAELVAESINPASRCSAGEASIEGDTLQVVSKVPDVVPYKQDSDIVSKKEDDSLTETKKRKRKRSTSREESPRRTKVVDVIDLELPSLPVKVDKTRGWNDFERSHREELAAQHPHLSKKSINKKLGRLYHMSKSAELTESESSDGPRSKRARVVSEVPNSGGVQTPFPWGNLRSNLRRERNSHLGRSRRPFAQIDGRLSQAVITVQILQSLLYEEDIYDLCIADMIHVWRRDFDERTEKVAALVINYAKPLVQALSATDRRDPSERYRREQVMPENIWRSTTLYEQLFRLFQISDQDCDLNTLIDWESEDIFNALEVRDGIWFAKDEEKFRSMLSSKARKRVSTIVVKSEDESSLFGDDTKSDVNMSVMESEVDPGSARKGKPSLRPAAITNTSKYFRNGAGPLVPKVSNSNLRVTKPALQHEEDHDDSGSTLRAKQEEEDSIFSDAAPEQGRWTTSHQFTQPVADPISQLKRHTLPQCSNSMMTSERPLHMKVVRLRRTTGNNAGIWRCKMANCYFFQDDADTLESQKVINEHFSAHADATLEALDLLGDPTTLTGASTAALLKKLERNAQDWTDEMKNDVILLG